MRARRGSGISSEDPARLPFELPSQPVDGYEVRWWSVEVLGHETKVVPHRAVFHKRRSWTELFEPDGRPPGAGFVNEWQVFRRERFTGRSEGWRDGWSDYDWGLDFGSERDALLKAVEFTEATIAKKRDDLRDLQRSLAEFRERLASP